MFDDSKLNYKRINGVNLGKIISRATEPIMWIPFVLWLVMDKLRFAPEQAYNDYFIALLFFYIFPLGYALYVIFITKTVDIDISDQDKRIRFALWPMFSVLIGVVISYFINKVLFIIALAAFISALVLVTITYHSKISYHSGLNALYFCIINYLYNWEFWWLFLILIPISWGRWALKKHSIVQLCAGVVASGATFFSVTYVFVRVFEFFK
jgi:hypothetical protein